MSKIKILYVTSEIKHYYQYGGVADVSYALTKELTKTNDLIIAIPLYKHQKKNVNDLLLKKKAEIGSFIFEYEVYKNIDIKNLSELRIYFFHVYKTFEDLNPEKNEENDYLYFNLAIHDFINNFEKFDVIHCGNDWACSFLPYLNDQQKCNNKFLFTIHLHSAQSEYDDIIDFKFNTGLSFNPFLSAIKHADYINTVSVQYCKEILEGKHNIFKDQKEYFHNILSKKFTGITNGIDDSNNPETDTNLIYNYNINEMVYGKDKNKKAIQEIFKLPKKDVPLIACLFRINEMKGITFLIGAIKKHIKDLDIQLVFCSNGDFFLEKEINHLVDSFPDKIAYRNFDFKLSQMCYAGADFAILPSLFEPCGLLPMIAMRYGTIPIVSKVGGMIDTCSDIINELNYEFWLEPKSEHSIASALLNTIMLYEDRCKLHIEQKKCMIHSEKFTWNKVSEKYNSLYYNIVMNNNPKNIIENQFDLLITEGIGQSNGISYKTNQPFNCLIQEDNDNIFIKHNLSIVNNFWWLEKRAPLIYFYQSDLLTNDFMVEVMISKVIAKDFHCGLFVKLTDSNIKYLFGNHTSDQLVIQSPHRGYFNDIFNLKMEIDSLKIKIEKINNYLFFYYQSEGCWVLVHQEIIDRPIMKIGLFSKNWTPQEYEVIFSNLRFQIRK